jgi:peroxiredoxin
LAQLSQDYEKFQELETEILAIAADTMGNAKDYFKRNKLPFSGLSDSDHSVYDQYDVQSKLLSLGQRPGLFIVDKDGIIQFSYVGSQQWEIPSNQEILKLLANHMK